MNHVLRMRAQPAVTSLVLALLAACGGSPMRLVVPGTSPGSRYSCVSGEGKVCQPATTDVPSEFNEPGTVFVILPRECRGRVHQIIVLDAGSSTPKVDATCAPDEEPVEEMSNGEPSRTPSSQRLAEGGE